MTDCKRVLVTPEMFGLLKRIQTENLKPLDISHVSYASKSLKALVGRDLVKLDEKYFFRVTERGSNLLSLTPRWSGEVKDRFGRKIQTWSITDTGDGFQQFSDHARPHQIAARKVLPANHEHSNYFE